MIRLHITSEVYYTRQGNNFHFVLQYFDHRIIILKKKKIDANDARNLPWFL